MSPRGPVRLGPAAVRRVVARIHWLDDPCDIVVDAPAELAAPAGVLAATLANAYAGAHGPVHTTAPGHAGPSGTTGTSGTTGPGRGDRPVRTFGVELSLQAGTPTAAIVRDDAVIDTAEDLALAVPLLLWCATEVTLERCRQLGLVALHAAALARGPRTVLIAGASGAGKSTLAGALVRAGAGLVGDEVVAVDATGGVRGVPRPLLLDAASCALLGIAAPGTGDERAVGPGLLGGAWAQPPAHGPVTVVLPRVRPGAAVEAQPVGRAEALTEIAQSCFGFADAPGAALGALAALVRRAHTVRLSFGDATAAARWLHGEALA